MRIDVGYDFVTKTRTFHITLARSEVQALAEGDAYVQDFSAELARDQGFALAGGERTRFVLTPVAALDPTEAPERGGDAEDISTLP